MAPTPSPSPAEDPQKLVDLQDSAKQTSFIDELAKGHNLTPEERKMFEEKYKKAIDELTKKHEGKKDIIIAEISDILKTFKESLQHEKNDDDDITEFTSTNPDKEKEVDTEKKLGGKEIDEHIQQLSAKIEAKLNTPATTPPENPADKPPVGAPISKDLPALNIDPNLPDIPEFKNPKQKGGLVEFIINWLGTTGIGGWIRKFIMGYNTIEEMTDTMAAMKNIMSIKKESPISSIINLTHITEYDFRDILRKNPRLDFSNMRNVEAAFLGKHAEDPKLAKYHCIYNGIGDMAEKMGATDSIRYDPIARFGELLGYSKKPEFKPDYTEDKVDTPVAVDVPQEKTEAEQKAEEEKRKLSELEEAEKADTEAADSTNPDQGKAMEEVKEIKNKSKERLIVSVENVEKELKTNKDKKVLLEQERKIIVAGGNKEELDKKDKEIITLDSLIYSLESEEGILKNIMKIAEKCIKDITLPKDKWELKESTTAKESVEWAQSGENEVQKIEAIKLKIEKEGQQEDTIGKKEKEKVSEEITEYSKIYTGILKDPMAYFHDKKLGFVYVANEKGELFRFEFNGGMVDNTAQWLGGIFGTDNNLPRDGFAFDPIYKLTKNGTWEKTEFKTNSWSGPSPWESQLARNKMLEKAPKELKV